MSYNVYPVVTTAFLVDPETAAYINVAAAKRSGSLEGKIAKMLESGEFYTKAKAEALPEEYHDALDAILNLDKLNEHSITCCHGEFEGAATTAYPELAGEDISLNFDGDQIAYLAPSKGPDMLAQRCYQDEHELLAEFQTILRDAGVEMPDTYNWWAHIVNITGTYGC